MADFVLKSASTRKIILILLIIAIFLVVLYLSGGEYAATARHFVRTLFRSLF